MKRESMNSIIPIRNVEFVNLAKEKTALNLFPVYAIWMREIIEMMAGNYTVPKRWHRETIAAIFMSQELKRRDNFQAAGLENMVEGKCIIKSTEIKKVS